MLKSEKLQICLSQSAPGKAVTRFIQSWGVEDVYKRFGWVSPESQRRLAAEVANRARHALVALHGDEVVALLDYAHSEQAIHIGLVVDSKFRRWSIGTLLLRVLLQMKGPAQAVIAECSAENPAAIALLRKCRFQCIGLQSSEMTWRYA